ncbi:hypothetical protein HYZ99_00505 [Candidatus Peregrinibacteria bacterium]|nr:hypothetical protein [Candidatus Peregrinibacteria bacterium]
MKAFLSRLWNFLGIVLTGGKYGSEVPSEHSYNYSKIQEQRRKDFAKFGTHACKICGTKIPGNKKYCGACYFKYIKK